VTGPRGLLEVERFRVPGEILNQTIDLLQEIGDYGLESFVLYGGVLRDGGRVIECRTVYRPRQLPMRTPYGLAVSVPGEELARLNLLLFERGEILAVQVHSHPTDAYHSETDDVYPLVTLLGSVSGVAPDFAKGGIDDLGRWAWYRLVGIGEWLSDSADLVEVF